MNMDIVRQLAREVGLESLESAIKPGAVATSETLNRFRQNVDAVLEGLSEEVRQYREEVQRVDSWAAHMVGWMYNHLLSASAQLAAASSGWEYRVADPFGTSGWTFSDPTMHNQQFGQITPPVASDVSTINPKKEIFVTPSFSSPAPVARGEMRYDLTTMMSDAGWSYPVVLPDIGASFIWIYCPLNMSYNYTNNLSIALLPWSGVQIEQIWTLTGSSWNKVYQTGSFALAAGRFWWDVRQVGKPQAIGVLLRKLAPLPVALVHFSPNATTFKESGTVQFNTAAAFGYAFSILQYQVAVTFPASGGQFTASLSGSGNTMLNMTVKRITAQVPTVVSGVQLRRA